MRLLRAMFWSNTVILVSAASMIFLGRHEDRIRLVLISARDSLFTSFSSDVSRLNLTQADLSRTGFLQDSEAGRAFWRTKLDVIPEVVSPLEAAATSPDDIALAKAIVLSFSVGGGTGEQIYFMDWPERIRRARRGGGLCSDHTKLFMALAELVSLSAREVQNGKHAFVDFFSPRRQKWVFVDPLYAVMATDGRGTYLSSVELRYRGLHDMPIHFVFFGTSPRHIRTEEDVRLKAYYGDRKVLARYVLTNGNNVATQASVGFVPWVPWEVRELYLYLSAQRPQYIQFVDESTESGEITIVQRTRLLVLGIVGYFAVSLILYPLLCAAGRVGRRGSRLPPGNARAAIGGGGRLFGPRP